MVPLITELCKAYENQKQSFVIVSNEDSLIVMEKIRSVIKIPKNITILARKGAAWQKSVLDRINLEKAKQVIILKPDISELFKTEMDCDVEVGKSLSSIIGSKEYNKSPCKILSEFHNERTGMAHILYSTDIWSKAVAKLGNDLVPAIISSNELKSDILSQCTNTPDLTEIYDNLFGYEGSEIYFVDPENIKFKDVLNKNIGKNIKDLNRLCDNIIVIGFFLNDQSTRRTRNKIFLNTPIDFPLTKGFGIVCIAKDEDQIIKELNELESHEKEVKDINPKLKQDDQSLNISIVDFSTERNKEYLSKLVRKLVNSNYYDNLKKINIYHNEKVEEENSLDLRDSINTKEEYELINLGVIFHGINTDHKNYYKFQIYKVNPNSLLYSKVKPADEILNIIKKDDLKNDLDEKEYCYYSKVGGNIENRLKSKLNDILKENNEIIIILKKYDSQKIEFLEISKQELLEYRSKILKEFDDIELKRKNFQKTVKIESIQKNLDKFSENITDIDYFEDYEKEFEKSNCIILLNETNQQIQKFRENPIEDHGMINNFIGFSKVRRHHPEKNQSLITDVNGFRTKKILQDFKFKYYSPFIGNDVVEMNSIVSKYIAAATFDLKHTNLINLLFQRVHTLKSHTLLDKSLSTTFCELEKYFQNKNEVLIGIIDYDFSLSRRKIKNISINPEQRQQIDLDEGDRLITIANFNDLEMVSQNRNLHIL